jgi:putative intracellular protease/amidase
MQIAIPIFNEVTALDAIGPYEVLQRLPDATVVFVGHELGEVRSDNGFLGLSVDATFEMCPNPDVVVVPGGQGTRPLITDGTDPIIEWVQSAHPTTRFTTSVCTGSLVLAAAGLLDGLDATTHWGAYGDLERLGAIPTGTRVVEHIDERIITAAGVSSGIDMALRLSELLVDETAARAMQLMIEYDPQPPFDSGSVSKAGDEVMTRAIEYFSVKK